MSCYYQNLRSLLAQLPEIIKRRRIKLQPVAIAALLMCGVFAKAQNVTTATNGLSKPSASEVGLGGTLIQHTDIDLGASFNLGFKKGSTSYLSILNNGNIRLGRLNNNATLDSILTTDVNGNLILNPS